MAYHEFNPRVPSAKATLAYAGIVAANCPGQSRKKEDGIEVMTKPVLFEDDLGNPESYVRLRLKFDPRYRVHRAILERAPFNCSNFRLGPSEVDYKQFRIISRHSSPNSRRESRSWLSRIRNATWSDPEQLP